MTGDKIYNKVSAQLKTVDAVKDFVIISGGLALHLMSPKHIEDKYIHDHSDIDLFVTNQEFFQKIKDIGFHKIWSKYDSTHFSRYHKTAEDNGKRVKVLIDAFIIGPYTDFPYITINELRIIHPSKLISLYEQKLHHPGKESTSAKYRANQIAFLKQYMQQNKISPLK